MSSSKLQVVLRIYVISGQGHGFALLVLHSTLSSTAELSAAQRYTPRTSQCELSEKGSCQKRAVAYQRSLLKAIDKLVPQVGAAGYKATPSYAIVKNWSKFLVSFLTFCLDMR